MLGYMRHSSYVSTVIREIDMKTLIEVVKESRDKYYQDRISPILYRLYEDGELVYVGIGGVKGNRKGFLRLREHYKASMPSSLKSKILVTRLSKPTAAMNPYQEAVDYWNSLLWEFETGDAMEIANKEKELIKMYQPKYNIEFKK